MKIHFIRNQTLVFGKKRQTIKLKPEVRVEVIVARPVSNYPFVQKPQITVLVSQASGP